MFTKLDASNNAHPIKSEINDLFFNYESRFTIYI